MSTKFAEKAKAIVTSFGKDSGTTRKLLKELHEKQKAYEAKQPMNLPPNSYNPFEDPNFKGQYIQGQPRPGIDDRPASESITNPTPIGKPSWLEKLFADGGKVNLAKEIKNGVAVEREHAPTLEYVKSYFAQTGQFPTVDKFAKSIMSDHEGDFRNISDNPQQSYYQRLIDNKLSDEVSKYALGGEVKPVNLTDADIAGIRMMASGGGIHIKPENRGKFTAYKERTGKTTAEALHSPDPHVRQMANFARNAAKWKHADGGNLFFDGSFLNRKYSTQDNQNLYYSPSSNNNAAGQLLNTEQDYGEENLVQPTIAVNPTIKKSAIKKVNNLLPFDSASVLSNAFNTVKYTAPDPTIAPYEAPGYSAVEQPDRWKNLTFDNPTGDKGIQIPATTQGLDLGNKDWSNILPILMGAMPMKAPTPLENNMMLPRINAQKFAPDYLSTAPITEQLGSQYRTGVESLTGASGGSSSAMRSGILGLDRNMGRAAGEAITDINAKNIGLKNAATESNLGRIDMANQFNAKQGSMEAEQYAKTAETNKELELAAKQRNRNYLDNALNNILKLNKQNKDRAMVSKVSGYDPTTGKKLDISSLGVKANGGQLMQMIMRNMKKHT